MNQVCTGQPNGRVSGTVLTVLFGRMHTVGTVQLSLGVISSRTRLSSCFCRWIVSSQAALTALIDRCSHNYNGIIASLWLSAINTCDCEAQSLPAIASASLSSVQTLSLEGIPSVIFQQTATFTVRSAVPGTDVVRDTFALQLLSADLDLVSSAFDQTAFRWQTYCLVAFVRFLPSGLLAIRECHFPLPSSQQQKITLP
jgi:hypothetical protein